MGIPVLKIWNEETQQYESVPALTGKQGEKPVRGVDYWTAEDVQTIINGVLAQKSVILETVFPVGSEYVTSTNTDPATMLGFGTWELVGKGFVDAQGNGTTTLFTLDETNTTSCTVYYRRTGNTLWLKFTLKNAVAIAETNLTLGTLVLSKLGVSSLSYQTLHMLSFGSENGVVMCSLTNAGKLNTAEVAIKGSGTSVAAATTFYGQITLPLRAEDMLDSACDKFYWKRTA